MAATPPLKYEKMHNNAFDLTKGSAQAAGFDLKRFNETQIIFKFLK